MAKARNTIQTNSAITTHADQAELFGDDGKQEIGVRLGQACSFSTLAPSPTPSHSPRPNAISECDSW